MTVKEAQYRLRNFKRGEGTDEQVLGEDAAYFGDSDRWLDLTP